jgi:hypothetical protein
VLAGLIAVASGATGECTSWRCGKTTLDILQFVGGEISHGFLVQDKFVQLSVHFPAIS